MKNLKWITSLNLVLYGLFICVNILELIWNGYIYSLGNKWIISESMSFSTFFMKSEIKVHTILNWTSLVALILFLVFANRFVKKNDLGKSYHFLIVILAFVPFVSYFLYYIIWRKLNQSVFRYLGGSVKESDRVIVLIWILELSVILGSVLLTSVQYYSNSPELVSLATRLKDFELIAHSVYLLILSILYLFYFVHFKKRIMQGESGVRDMSENELID